MISNEIRRIESLYLIELILVGLNSNELKLKFIAKKVRTTLFVIINAHYLYMIMNKYILVLELNK